MANVVNNLRVNNQEVKKIFFNGKALKELWFKGVLIWKNANPFIFVSDLSKIDLSQFGEDTMIFTGFAPQTFDGSYSLVEDAEAEKPNLVQGQMVVETTEGDD